MIDYTVQPGDTLSEIAQHHHTQWRAIWQDNRASVHNPDLIFPGQVLHVREGRLEPGAHEPPENREHTPRHAAPTPPVTPVAMPQDSYQLVFGPQAACARDIVQAESGGDPRATNPVTGAYGLPQALPGSKMASAGADWATNPVTQLRWMKSYVDGRYGGACAAWSFWQQARWY